MTQYFYPVLATLAVSIISVVGILTLIFSDQQIKKFLIFLVAISAGTMIGGAFLHLLPESLILSTGLTPYLLVIAGFLFFFIVEKFLHWHHSHQNPGCDCDHHHHDKSILSYMTLVADSFHNLIDGLVIAASFAVNPAIGFVTTLAVITHEIPQEISHFGVLLYGGFSKAKALWYNFLSATVSILGAIVGVLISLQTNTFTQILLPITAGGFLYIAASDLIPEINHETSWGRSLASLLFFVVGIGIMYVSKLFLAV